MKRMKNNRKTSKHKLRRGNAMIMVIGILVLLVIVATSYIVRTNSGRTTSVAVRKTMLRDDKSKTIADMLADIIALQLFVRDYDAQVLGTSGLAESNQPLLSYHPLALRYEVDQTDRFNNFTGAPGADNLPDNPYNFPPFHVVASTNWPDPDPMNPAEFVLWPSGPGNPSGPFVGTLAYEGNPIGNPGFGDNRSLADNEPLRWDTSGHGIEDAYSHWRHMSNISTANNGFRIVFGIDDIGDSDGDVFGIGTIITDLGMPFEQWLKVMPAPSPFEPGAVFDPITGNAIFRNDFYARWSDWFFNYSNTYSDPARIPPNFYNLRFLGLPQDEFIAGTDRHIVSSVLADTDGDGFTDAFWMLAPTMTESGIRQIIAVRIIDNSAMLNVNVGTQFVHADPLNSLGFKTRGVTPADLQLVGDIGDTAYFPDLRVGYIDIPDHHETGSLYGNTTIGYDANAWDGSISINDANYLAELGVQNNANFPDQFTSAPDRLFYWQAAGSKPFDPQFGVTPFGLTEELELRAYHGQNSAWIVSRLEKAVQENTTNSTGVQFLHANLGRTETSELLDQLNVRELLFDHRKRLTTYSGARNDLMPPWLWWRWDVPTDVNDQGQVAIDNFRAQHRRKMDLRELNPLLDDGESDFATRLPDTLLLALTDGDHINGHSYFGSYTTANDQKYINTQRAAAAFAANILEWSDDDAGYVDLQTAAVPLPGPGGVGFGGATPSTRFLGMERQPFLVEALIAHVHKATTDAEADHLPDIQEGDNIMCSSAPGSTVVVVQIANPFDDVLELAPFQIRVFGQSLQLPTSTLSPGAFRTYYAIEDDFEDGPLEGPWRTRLEFDSIVTVNVTGHSWSTERSFYDSLNPEEMKEAVEIYRTIGTTDVLVDRIDIASPTSLENFDYGESIGETLRDALPTGSCFNEPGVGVEWPGVESIGSNTHWIQWSHVTRAWEKDLNNDSMISPDERNPRYVFSYREVSVSENNADGYLGVVPDTNPAKFDLKDKGDVTGTNTLNFSMQMLQKDDDFEQIGELLNVFMFGHELEFNIAGPTGVYDHTIQTFSEFMIDKSLVGKKERVNRLHISPSQNTVIGGGGGGGIALIGRVIGIGDTANINDPLHSVPALPAGIRVLDAFVCDGPGINGLVGDEYLGANAFSGKITPGLLNVNTVAQEVMRAIPHNYRLVHELDPPSFNPYVEFPKAMVRYRERIGTPGVVNEPPAYGFRGGSSDILDQLRGDRGIASIGELMLIDRPATYIPDNPGGLEPNSNYQISFAGRDPYQAIDPNVVESTRISIDLNDVRDSAGNVFPDDVSKDVEELNLLFAGMSNLLTTRSDVFTVYFKIRSFRQNPVGPNGVPVWDATDPEFIVDDSRYVMLVDRSEVNKPTDKPKILYLEKLSK